MKSLTQRWPGMVLALAVWASAAFPALALPRERDRWIRVETDNFTLISNAPPRQTRDLGLNLERLREVLATTSTNMTVHSPLPTRIYVFRNDESFRPYKPGADGKPRNLAGYFAGGNDGNYVALDASAGHEPFAVIFHEYVHYWIETNVPNVPLWLSEGLAEFYSTFESDGNTADIGRHIESHLWWLSHHALIPLDELFALTTDSPDYNEGRRQGTVYAQSWALTHYLLAGNSGRRESLGEYLRLIAGKHDATEAFTEAFQVDRAGLDKELRAYTRQGAFNFYRYTFKEALRTSDSRLQELDYKETLFLLGDLLAHTPPIRFDDAERHLRAALEIDDEYAEVYATLGFLRSLQDDPEGAEALFRRAVELKPDDARSRWLYGDALVQRFMRAFEGSKVPFYSTTPPLMKQARKHFSRSLELAPDHPPSLAGLGKTYVFDERPAEGVEVLTRACKALPHRTDLLVDLIVVTANSGRTSEARKLLDRSLRQRGNAEMTRIGELAVAQAEINVAIELFNDGQREPARKILQATAAASRDEEVRKLVADQISALAAAGVAGDEIERYNRAVTVANGGGLDAAIELLGPLAQAAEQPDLRAAAQELLDDLLETRRHSRLVDRFNVAIDRANAGDVEAAIELLQEILADGPDGPLEKRATRLLGELRRARR